MRYANLSAGFLELGDIPGISAKHFRDQQIVLYNISERQPKFFSSQPKCRASVQIFTRFQKFGPFLDLEYPIEVRFLVTMVAYSELKLSVREVALDISTYGVASNCGVEGPSPLRQY